MGGKALKNTQTQRLDKADFERVSIVVVEGLQAAVPLATVKVIPAYFSKPDFGDLDVLVTSEPVQAAGGGELLKKLAYDTFNATDLFKNGNVLSFDYRATPEQTEPGFQVDVITMSDEAFDYALSYFSYNDLGNLVGRTAHKAGLTHGHDGLWYYFREGDYLFRNILLTRDHDTALAFLGYDPKRFHEGFETLEDIFQYVSGSAFFNRDIFLLENRNAAARVRDKKRKTYSDFLKWCEDRPDLPAFQYPEDKTAWIPRIAEHFPHFKIAYDQTVRDLEELRAVKERFSGELVSQWTGLSDKTLGMLMKNFKESFETPEAMRQFVLTHSADELQFRIKELQATLGL